MKTVFALQECAYVNEWFGILPNDVTLLMFRKRRSDIQALSYKSYSIDRVKTVVIPRYISSENNFTTIKIVDHIFYTLSAFALLPYILTKKSVVIVTPPFWVGMIVPFLKLFKKDVYIVSSDPQTRLYYTAKESRNPLIHAYWNAANLLEKLTIKLSTKVFVVSQYSRKLYSRYNKNVVCTPNGADTDLIESTKPKRRFKKFTITYMGSFDPWRSVDMLVEAFLILQKRHKNIKLLLIGGGNMDRVREMSKGNSDITITGWIESHEDVIAYCKGSDCLLMPPRKSEMAQTVNSMKCYEYIACEVPLVVTDTGEHAKLVRNLGVGLVCEANPEDIARSIEKMIKNKKLYRKFKDNCKEKKRMVDFKITRSPFIKSLNS